jgi:hypothetical protein
MFSANLDLLPQIPRETLLEPWLSAVECGSSVFS